jgi:predicted nucleic-acid-binding Zn-ribbon protein
MDENEARAEAREKYSAAIQAVWTGPEECPICGQTVWNLGDLVEIPIRNLTAPIYTVAPRKGYVYAPVACVNCGYTILFHTGALDSWQEKHGQSNLSLRAHLEGNR